MDWSLAKRRFSFLGSAFDASGGFCPSVTWRTTAVVDGDGAVTGYLSVPELTGPTELVRYPRESDNKFSARNAVAVYENHLESAVSRFISFLGRRRPQREGADSPLPALLVADADMRGRSLDDWLIEFARQTKARGSMLLVIDMPTGEASTTLADQIARRRVPYIRSATPESVVAYRIDPDTGLFVSVTIGAREWWGDEEINVERDYTATDWAVRVAGQPIVLAQGEHGFGACPVLYMTETGGEFPVVGGYAQIADLSRRMFNARSERDEILRSQTFSLLTLQVPADQAHAFDAGKVSATVGTHSMLIHPGEQPAFIAPDAGPAATYAANIEELQQAIRRIAKEESVEQGAQAESGVARRMRFEALNADLATFARQLQELETRVWRLFRNAVGSGDVTVSWPTDFNLTDVLSELDILTSMQMTGFPPAVLAAKRRTIVSAEFDALPDDEKVALVLSVDELETREQQPDAPAGDDGQADTMVPGDTGAPTQATAEPGPDFSEFARVIADAIAGVSVPVTVVQAATPAPITIEGPQVTVMPPTITPPDVQVTVNPTPAPDVTVHPPSVTVQPPSVNVTVEKGGQLRFTEDADGKLTGAVLE